MKGQALFLELKRLMGEPIGLLRLDERVYTVVPLARSDRAFDAPGSDRHYQKRIGVGAVQITQRTKSKSPMLSGIGVSPSPAPHPLEQRAQKCQAVAPV